MQLSTRNRLPGTITEVVKGEAAAKVTLQVGDNHLVALITRESADELGLEPGKQATALVKATDVMILTESEAQDEHGERHGGVEVSLELGEDGQWDGLGNAPETPGEDDRRTELS